MQNDLISRSALIKTFEDAKLGEDSFVETVLAAGVYAKIENAPAIDAVFVVHGRWVYDRPNHYKCSECNAMWSGIVRFMNFCPNCGAKMDLQEVEAGG